MNDWSKALPLDLISASQAQWAEQAEQGQTVVTVIAIFVLAAATVSLLLILRVWRKKKIRQAIERQKEKKQDAGSDEERKNS